jgi:hypothetical protein
MPAEGCGPIEALCHLGSGKNSARRSETSVAHLKAQDEMKTLTRFLLIAAAAIAMPVLQPPR